MVSDIVRLGGRLLAFSLVFGGVAEAAASPSRIVAINLCADELLIAQPACLVISSLAPPAEGQGSALLAHPALSEMFPPAKRIPLPERLTVCGRPSLPAAIDWLSDQARRVAATL